MLTSLFHVNLRTCSKPCLEYISHLALTTVALTFYLLLAPAVSAPYSNLSGSCSSCFHLLLQGALCWSCKHYPISFNYTCKHISESKLCVRKSKLDSEMPKQFVLTSEDKNMIISANVDNIDLVVGFRFSFCTFGHIV